MPYIKKEKRELFWRDSAISTLIQDVADCGGDLNYLFTCLINEFIHKKGMSYATVNEVVGALECCKLELYRRKIAPYEDLKIKENGDV